MPSTDPLQFILVRLDLMQGHFTALETSNSSASSCVLNMAEGALDTEEFHQNK